MGEPQCSGRPGTCLEMLVKTLLRFIRVSGRLSAGSSAEQASLAAAERLIRARRGWRLQLTFIEHRFGGSLLGPAPPEELAEPDHAPRQAGLRMEATPRLPARIQRDW